MPRTSPYTILLSADETRELEHRAAKYTLPYREVMRAKLVLLAAQGLDNEEIARRLDMSRPIVSKWRGRFFHERLAGLEERPRGGRPGEFSPQRRGGREGAGLRIAR